MTIVALICCLTLPLQDGLANGGRGKGGGGKGHAHASGGKAQHGGAGVRDAASGGHRADHGNRSGSGQKFKSTHKAQRAVPGIDDAITPGSDLGSHPWSLQRAKELQKRDHRLSVADKLEELAERNGNSNLHDTAERMREKAWDHYEKRLAKIDSKDSGVIDRDDGGWFGDDGGLDDLPASRPTGNHPYTDQRLTGRENALARQLQNEQRNLTNRMETAQRLWDAYEQSGDELLAETARSFEERALAQFENRMEAISNFQQRFGLPTPAGIDPTALGPSIFW
jgi:hypothetical protein